MPSTSTPELADDEDSDVESVGIVQRVADLQRYTKKFGRPSEFFIWSIPHFISGDLTIFIIGICLDAIHYITIAHSCLTFGP